MAARAAPSGTLASPARAQVLETATAADYIRDPTRWGRPEVAALFPGFQHLDIRTSGAIIRLRHGGSGPPLLLLHGNPQNHVCWHKVLPDLRGYGDSSLPDPGPNHVNYTFRAMAQDMVEVEPTCSAREGTVMSNGLPWDNNSWEVAAEIARRHRHPAAAVMVPSGALTITTDTPLVLRASSEPLTQLLLRTVVAPDQGADKGKLIVGVLIPWFDIIEVLKKNPSAAFEIPWDKWEEIIAGAYKQSGFENVILTPRSGDYGRDVIAEKKALGTIRIIDSVKAFTPPNLVTADHVRALAGVLQADGASKGFLTTTSDFAPMIRQDPLITKFFPDRLELVNGEALLARLQELAENKGMARI